MLSDKHMYNQMLETTFQDESLSQHLTIKIAGMYM